MMQYVGIIGGGEMKNPAKYHKECRDDPFCWKAVLNVSRWFWLMIQLTLYTATPLKYAWRNVLLHTLTCYQHVTYITYIHHCIIEAVRKGVQRISPLQIEKCLQY
ncbi:hypothetical protein GDO81_007841 [Engystomops pustulosus]|uniref:Uncharacterized protein n=1 Tax=Engystomops pustulosus TaxID=76066 RepID=A0AAV7CAG4_ENGPU|nr:hypothetical protein GDO81_007841 [Engystomops pustulosus]